MSEGYGKKNSYEDSNDLDILISPTVPVGENLKIHCPKCGGELTRLETFLGPIEDSGVYPKLKKVQRLYWIVMCDECCSRYKIQESVYEVSDECTDPGKNSLRWT
jgi:PHP family Zn ribbon phosphoesterase